MACSNSQTQGLEMDQGTRAVLALSRYRQLSLRRVVCLRLLCGAPPIFSSSCEVGVIQTVIDTSTDKIRRQSCDCTGHLG